MLRISFFSAICGVTFALASNSVSAEILSLGGVQADIKFVPGASYREDISKNVPSLGPLFDGDAKTHWSLPKTTSEKAETAFGSIHIEFPSPQRIEGVAILVGRQTSLDDFYYSGKPELLNINIDGKPVLSEEQGLISYDKEPMGKVAVGEPCLISRRPRNMARRVLIFSQPHIARSIDIIYNGPSRIRPGPAADASIEISEISLLPMQLKMLPLAEQRVIKELTAIRDNNKVAPAFQDKTAFEDLRNSSYVLFEANNNSVQNLLRVHRWPRTDPAPGWHVVESIHRVPQIKHNSLTADDAFSRFFDHNKSAFFDTYLPLMESGTGTIEIVGASAFSVWDYLTRPYLKFDRRGRAVFGREVLDRSPSEFCQHWGLKTEDDND